MEINVALETNCPSQKDASGYDDTPSARFAASIYRIVDGFSTVEGSAGFCTVLKNRKCSLPEFRRLYAAEDLGIDGRPWIGLAECKTRIERDAGSSDRKALNEISTVDHFVSV